MTLALLELGLNQLLLLDSALEDGKTNDTTRFTISLYLKNGEEHNLLGQTTEDPNQIDEDAGKA